MRALVALMFLSACTSEPTARLHNHDAANDMALERVGVDGPFVAGTRERFRLVLEEEGPVTFTASEGELNWDGRNVEWTLPFAERAWLRAVIDTDEGEVSSTFNFAVWAVPVGARGPVDTGDDATGDVCDLEIDSGDTPHVIYRNDTHPSLWYATYNGASWQTELVDGMGWDTGGEVTTDMALTLDGSGTPHMVYIITVGNDMEVRYATWSGSLWIIETVIASSNLYQHVDIEIGATGEPVVLYSRWASGTGYIPTLATRVGADNWSISPGAASRYAAGGLELDGSDVMHITVTGSSTVYRYTWTSSGWSAAELVTTVIHSGERIALALDGSDRAVLLHEIGLEHDLGGSWSRSEIESWTMESMDLAFATIPHVALVHGGHLELVTPDSRGYWVYANVGSADGPVAVAVDTDGNTHACYQYNDRILFY